MTEMDFENRVWICGLFLTLLLCAVSLAGCGAVYGQQGGSAPVSEGAIQRACPSGKCNVTFVVTDEAQSVFREPFDTPPQQWATYESEPLTLTLDNTNRVCMPIGNGYESCKGSEATITGGVKEIKHWGCADPKRVLLTSEDQVKHCYDFSRLGDTSR